MQGSFTLAARLLTLCLLAIILSLMSFLNPARLEAATAQQFISTGEDLLYSETVDGVLQAHSIFLDAKADYPNDPVINAYLALTRLLHLGLTSGSGGGQALLNSYGISRTGSDLDTLDYHLPKDEDNNYDVPSTAPATEAVRSFAYSTALSAVNASIVNLNTTIANWNDASKHIVAKEKRGADLDIEIDYGDIYLFRAGLKALKAMVLTATAYDLNVDIREIAALYNLEAFSEENFLDRYQDFLELIPTSATPVGNGANQLAQARISLVAAINDYLVASEKIRNDNDLAPGAEELLEINQCDYLLEEWFMDSLRAVKTTLGSPSNPASEIPERKEEWVFTETSTGDAIRVILKYNRSRGKFAGIGGGDFVGYSGTVTCLTIDGSQIHIEMESSGWPYSEVAFAGSLNARSDAITGTYNAWSAEGPSSGSFSAVRANLSETIHKVNLNPLFGNGSGPYDLRDFLPRYNECDQPVPGTVGAGLNPSMPDATLGGILPDYVQADWGLDPVSCIASGNRVSGRLSVPDHDRSGLIYLQLFSYDGEYDLNPDNRLGFLVIYPEEFVEGASYSLDFLPVGVQAFVTAWWDVDLNGVLTSEDYWLRSPVFKTSSGQNVQNLTVNHKFGYLPASPWNMLLLLSD